MAAGGATGSGAPADVDRAGHLLGVLELGFDGFAQMLHWVDALRDGTVSPFGRTVGTHVDLAERHVRCGVRDGLELLGCHRLEASWDELATRVVRGELTLATDAPALLVGVDPDHARLEQVAAHVSVPVLNAGSNRHQPLQVLADVVTLRDLLGPLHGRHLVLAEPDLALRRSWAEACVLAGMRCTVTTLTGRRLLGTEFADAVAAADLFGVELLPITEWGVSIDDADVVVGASSRSRPAEEPARTRSAPSVSVAGLTSVRNGGRDVVVLPGHADAEEADIGHAGEEAAREVLFHRARNVTVVAAALVALTLRDGRGPT